jgi:hypothetical protein
MVRNVESNFTKALWIPIVILVVTVALSSRLGALERLVATTVILFLGFKIATLLGSGRSTQLSAYLLWPGIDPAPFQQAKEIPATDGPRFGQGLTKFLIGIFALLIVAGFSSRLGLEIATWLGIATILFAIHLGLSDMITALFQSMGWKVKPLFDCPLAARSLADFWTRRWNRPFVEMDRLLFLPPLTKRFGLRRGVLGVFLISGLLHEMAISFPAQGGFGGPLIYFAVQAACLAFEKHRRIKSRALALLCFLLPLPFLFHQPFREVFVWPLLQWLAQTMAAIDLPIAMTLLIFILSGAQLLVLAASFQVPTRLRWREELAQLGSLNRKLMWTYGGFIVYTIVAWSVLTFTLRGEILGRTSAGLAICVAIFLFWLQRLAVDTFYFRSDDWPKSPFMQIGHAMLNALFVFVMGGYGTLVAWNLGWI